MIMGWSAGGWAMLSMTVSSDGEHAFNGKIPFLKRVHLDKAHKFFEKYGGKAIILARFAPFFRTFVPFISGMASMITSGRAANIASILSLG